MKLFYPLESYFHGDIKTSKFARVEGMQGHKQP
jgi:hypothetical protein